MPKTLPLYEIGLVILTGNLPYGSGVYGYGTYGGDAFGEIRIGPLLPRVTWTVSEVVISTPSNTLPTFFLYRNGNSQAQLTAASLNGNADQVPFAGTPLSCGEFIVGQWIGGDIGAQATMIVTGEKRVPGHD